MDDKTPIERAIEFAGGSEAKLAHATGLSQPLINKAKKSGRVGPRLALAIHHLTKGEVPASELRPDLWESPEAVPSIAPLNFPHKADVA